MKKIFLLFFLLILQNPVMPFTLNAGISYTVDIARAEAFEGIPSSINIDVYRDYLLDKDNIKNLSAIKKKKYKFRNRRLTSFSSGNYSVSYKQQNNICYYYNNDGTLRFIAIDYVKNYPQKTAKYDRNGNLDSTSLTTSFDESYIFDANKNLIAHWIGNNCYNEKGELVMTRE